MCGVWGFVKETAGFLTLNEQKFIHNCALAGQVRGEDGFGVMVVYENGAVRTFKGIDTPNKMMKSRGWWNLFYEENKKNPKKPFEYKIKAVFGHNRAATSGEVIPRNTHPFRKDHITLMHNGTLNNVLPKDIDVDSYWITSLIAKEKDPDDAIDKLIGAFTLIWYNNKEKTINLLSNGQRPLHYVETSISRYYASEKLMLVWIMDRILKINNGVPKAESVPLHTYIVHDAMSKEVNEVPSKKSRTTSGNYSGKHYSKHNSTLYPVSTYRAGVANSERTNRSTLEQTRQKYHYKVDFPEMVCFKLRFDAYNSKHANGESCYTAVGDVVDKDVDFDTVLVVSKLSLELERNTTYLANVVGIVNKNSKKALLIKPNSIISVDDEVDPQPLVTADGKTISEEDYAKKTRCLSCTIPIERHEVKRAYQTQTGLICEDCSDSYVQQQNISESSHDHKHYLQ